VTDPDPTELAAIAAIERLKARYFRMIDTKDWDGLVRVFTDEITVDIAGMGEPSSGPRTTTAAEFVEGVAGALAGSVTVHHGHMPEIELQSATTASGTWAMEDEIWWPPADSAADSAADGAAGLHLHGYGHYHETYVRLDAGWRISTMQLTRLRVDLT
jgi:hypothetical protein